jgi:hypothetical protein
MMAVMPATRISAARLVAPARRLRDLGATIQRTRRRHAEEPRRRIDKARPIAEGAGRGLGQVIGDRKAAQCDDHLGSDAATVPALRLGCGDPDCAIDGCVGRTRKRWRNCARLRSTIVSNCGDIEISTRFRPQERASRFGAAMRSG